MQHLFFLVKTKSTGTPDELADKLGVSRRQVYRRLQALRECGCSISYCYERRSYCMPGDTEFPLQGFLNHMQQMQEMSDL